MVVAERGYGDLAYVSAELWDTGEWVRYDEVQKLKERLDFLEKEVVKTHCRRRGPIWDMKPGQELTFEGDEKKRHDIAAHASFVGKRIKATFKTKRFLVNGQNVIKVMRVR